MIAAGRSVVASCLVLVSIAFSDTPRPDAATETVLARIEKRMAEVSTIRARFRQVKRIPLFAQQMELRGEIALEKPDRFAWRVTEPIPYRLVLDKSGFQQWDAETGRVQKGRLDTNPVLRVVVDQLTGFFSGRFLTMTREFDIVVSRADPVELTGRPRSDSPASGGIKSFTARFGADERYIAGITVVESDGGETNLQFEDVKLNSPLPPDFWKISNEP